MCQKRGKLKFYLGLPVFGIFIHPCILRRDFQTFSTLVQLFSIDYLVVNSVIKSLKDFSFILHLLVFNQGHFNFLNLSCFWRQHRAHSRNSYDESYSWSVIPCYLGTISPWVMLPFPLGHLQFLEVSSAHDRVIFLFKPYLPSILFLLLQTVFVLDSYLYVLFILKPQIWTFRYRGI